MDHTIFWYWYYYERCIDTLRCYDSSFLIYYSYLWITNYTNIIWWWLLLIWQLILLLLLLRQLIFLLLFKSMKIHQHHLLAICYDIYFVSVFHIDELQPISFDDPLLLLLWQLFLVYYSYRRINWCCCYDSYIIFLTMNNQYHLMIGCYCCYDSLFLFIIVQRISWYCCYDSYVFF